MKDRSVPNVISCENLQINSTSTKNQEWSISPTFYTSTFLKPNFTTYLYKTVPYPRIQVLLMQKILSVLFPVGGRSFIIGSLSMCLSLSLSSQCKKNLSALFPVGGRSFITVLLYVCLSLSLSIIPKIAEIFCKMLYYFLIAKNNYMYYTNTSLLLLK